MKKPEDDNQVDWDSICARCGRCCYEKIDFEGKIYYTDLPCEFLDTAKKLCMVYGERDRRRPGCVRLTRDNIKKGFLPEDCPYVRDIDNYPAPKMSDDPDP